MQLPALEKEAKNLRFIHPAQSGPDYRDWPIIKPTAQNDFEIKEAHYLARCGMKWPCSNQDNTLLGSIQKAKTLLPGRNSFSSIKTIE